LVLGLGLRSWVLGSWVLGSVYCLVVGIESESGSFGLLWVVPVLSPSLVFVLPPSQGTPGPPIYHILPWNWCWSTLSLVSYVVHHVSALRGGASMLQATLGGGDRERIMNSANQTRNMFPKVAHFSSFSSPNS
jgi:hypothetical protein